MKKLNFYSKEILKPVLKDKKYVFLYTIRSNMINILSNKYLDYCKIDKITINKEKIDVYLITYNSAISFYINNNKEYIKEKINTLFGYNIVANLYIKEVPKIIKQKNNTIKINKNFKLKEYDNINQKLKIALEDLGSTIFVD